MNTSQIAHLLTKFRGKMIYLLFPTVLLTALVVYGQDIEDPPEPDDDDESRQTGPWVDEDGAKDFFLTIPEVVEGAVEGGDPHQRPLPEDSGEIPSGGIASPLFGARPFSQHLLRFEEFGTKSLTGTVEHHQTLPVPGDPSGFPDGVELDNFLALDGFDFLPTEYSNVIEENPWKPVIESFLGRELETPPIEGRPPGKGWAHQRWNEFLPEVYFKTIQTGARINRGVRDSLQRHGYSKGEFGPGGLYYHGFSSDDDGDLFPGSTNGIEVKFHPGFPVQDPTSLWTFDGTFPPKLLIGRYGEPILMRHYNGLPIDPAANNGFGLHTITTHEHNGHNPAESDGYAGAFFFPGQYRDYRWPMALAGYDTVNTTASDPRAAFPAAPGEQIFVNDLDPGMRAESSGRIQIRGDWRETMSTHWFHDHMIDHTAQNVYKGNAAMFNYYSAVDRGNEALDDGVNLRFPSGSELSWGNRDYDVNLLIADKAWDAQGQLFFNPFDRDGFLGDRVLVNWQWTPFIKVRHRSYRFRLLNGAVARYFKIALVKEVQGNGGELRGPNNSGVSYDRVGFHLIANDGNVLEHAIPFDGSMDLDSDGNASEHKGMLPTQGIGERYDIIIDFDSQGIVPGDKLYFVNTLEHDDGRGPKDQIPLSEILSGDYVAELKDGIWDKNDPAVGKFLEFRVYEYDGEDLSMDPADYTPGNQKMIPLSIDRNNIGNVRTRSFEFERSSGTDSRPWTIKTDGGPGLNADTRRVSAAPRLATGPTEAGFDGTNGTEYDQTGTLEKWTLSGGGGWDHPVHIHFEEGVILSKDGEAPPLWEMFARKDIYRIGPSVDSAREITIALRFREFAGTFVEHCHNTTHEDHAMLLRWDAERPGQVKVMPTPVPSWDGVEYVDSVALPTFRSGSNGPELPDNNPFLTPIINSFSGTSENGITKLTWAINEDSKDNVIAIELSPGIGSVLGRRSAVVNPTQTTIYRLTATSPAGTSTATITVSPNGDIDDGDIDNGGIPGDNLLTNGDFESGLDDWIAETSPGGTAETISDASISSNVASLSDSILHRRVAVTAFSQYILSAKYRNSGSPEITMGIEFFDILDNSLDTVQINPTPGSTYQTASVRAKAPASATSARLFFESASTGTTFIDDVLFAEETVIPPTEPAQYRIQFTGLFDSTNHPSANFPNSAQFSPLFAATHNTNDRLWSEDTLAGEALRQLCETGDLTPLAALIDGKIGGDFGEYATSASIVGGTDTAELEITATADHPFLSLLTKVSPSPDWFTGLTSVDLSDVNGEWIQSLEIDLFPQDAGTDSGPDFESADIETVPQEEISSLEEVPPFSDQPIAKILITRLVDEPVIEGDNLLTNEGFEQGFEDWNIYTHEGGSATITSSSANGTSAAELSGAFIYRSVPVAEDTNYTLAAQYYSFGDTDLAMGIEYFDISGNLLSIHEINPSTNELYETASVSATSPEGAVLANIYFYSGGTGTTRVDAFTFHTVSFIPDEPTPGGDNLLLNGSFEPNLKFWKKVELTADRSNIRRSSVSFDGLKSCLLLRAMIHQSVDAQEGMIFSLQGHYTTLDKSPDAEAGISFFDVAGNELAVAPVALEPNEEFEPFSVQVQAPENTVSAKVFVWSDRAGKLYVDDLKLTAFKKPDIDPGALPGPNVTLSTDAERTNQPFSVRVSFTEAVSGLDSSDFVVTNGTINGFSQISPSEYFVIVKKSNKKTIEVLLPEATVVDSDGNDNRESNLLLVDFDPNLNLQLDPEIFRLSLTSGVPQPIPLEPGQFINPVVFATVQHDDPTIPMHAQVSDVSSSQFTVTVQRLDGLNDPVSDVMVHTVILETGTYNSQSTGIKMEVGTTLVDNVSGKVNGYSGGKTVQLLKNYNDPVVIGQVQTANSSNPGEFWSRLDDQGFLTVGHHVGELPSPLNDGEETVAYAVVEAGKGVFEETRWEAANFTTDSSGATVDVARNINSSVNIVVSQHGMEDPDGSVPVIESTTRDTLTVRLLEDKLGDSEMDHGEEKAGYLLIRQ